MEERLRLTIYYQDYEYSGYLLYLVLTAWVSAYR